MVGSGVPVILSALPDTFTFAWVVAILFGIAWVLDARGLAAGRSVAAGTWGLFGLFWLTMVPYFAFEHQSYVESILALVGVRPGVAGRPLADVSQVDPSLVSELGEPLELAQPVPARLEPVVGL